jgi:hypothetical protein
MRSAVFCSVTIAIFCVAGCRDDGRIPTYPAGGIVRTNDGTPFAGGAIICESPHGLAARGVISDDGTFKLGTYDVDDGAVEGKHKVAIRPRSSSNFDPDAGGKRLPETIDRRYLSVDTSGIEIEVTPAGPNQFQLELDPPNRPR